MLSCARNGPSPSESALSRSRWPQRGFIIMNGSPLLLSSIRLCHSVSVFFLATGGIAESSFKWHWLETSVSSAEGFQQGSPVVIEMQIPAAPWWHAEAKWVKPNRHKCVEKWLKSDFRCTSVKVKPLKVPRMKVESALPAHTAELQGFCFSVFSLFYSQNLIHTTQWL